MGQRIGRDTWLRFVGLVGAGMPVSQATERLGMDYAAAMKFCRAEPSSTGHAVWLDLCRGVPLWENYRAEQLTKITRVSKGSPPPSSTSGIRRADELSSDAREALGDGRLFRERYFGRRTVYWQDHLWDELSARWHAGRRTGERQFLVANMPPGSGKTVLTHDFACRVIVEDRTIRIGNFSGAAALAVRNTARQRRTLERATPQRAKPVDKDRGLAIDAVATLAGDFGALKPAGRDVWNQWAFIVAQEDDEVIAEKEPTCAAFGFDQSYIGNRLDVILADDMVDKRVTRNPEVMLAQREVWDTETETRLEPGGLLLVIGQRLSADDLYHYCLSQRIPMDDEELAELDLVEEPQRYAHIVYPAHDDDTCRGEHSRSVAKAWPEGCLLDPPRLPWKELAAIQAKNHDRYEVVYQQRDAAPGSALVHPAWIHGGVDHRNEHHAPAWDLDRSVWQVPKALNGPTTGIVTVDPSSTRYWACIAALYDPPEDERGARDFAGRRYLLDLSNTKMEAPELLGYNLETRQFYGLLEQWWQNYRDIGQRLHAVVVEQNHAQRFLLQYDHARTWSTLRSVQFVPHNTAANKLDPDIGVTSIAEHWRYGRVRLPGRTEADHIAMDPLVRQVTTWPRAALDDQVMAYWFLEVQLPQLAQRARRTETLNQSRRRPSWLKSRPRAARSNA